MPNNHLSMLGIIHTAISILAILIALAAIILHGRIIPSRNSGKTYIFLTVLTCITGLPIMKTGHPTAGHFLAVIILVLLPLGIYARVIFGKISDYAQTVIMTLTLFFSMIPAVVETMTRLPASHPVAVIPGDTIVQNALKCLAALFAILIIVQLVKLRNKKRLAKKTEIANNQNRLNTI